MQIHYSKHKSIDAILSQHEQITKKINELMLEVEIEFNNSSRIRFRENPHDSQPIFSFI